MIAKQFNVNHQRFSQTLKTYTNLNPFKTTITLSFNYCNLHCCLSFPLLEQVFRRCCVDPLVFDRWGYTSAMWSKIV